MRMFLKAFALATTWLSCQVTSFDLKGKRAFVTGSSGGIGAGIAKRLAQEGCEVLLHYNVRRDGALHTQAIIQEDIKGICAGIVKCDFRKTENVHKLYECIDEVWPDGFDVLVNNAGIVSKRAIMDDDDELGVFQETLQVNLYAPLLLAKLAYPRMNKNGCIINVSSIHGINSNEWMSAYACSKAGLDSLTKTMSLEFAEKPIRVNSINPGVVVVERTKPMMDDPAVTKMWTDRLPLKKLGETDKIADATIPLITSDWMTGSIVIIDGGMMARAYFPDRPRPLVSRDQDPMQGISIDVKLERNPASATTVEQASS